MAGSGFETTMEGNADRNLLSGFRSEMQNGKPLPALLT